NNLDRLTSTHYKRCPFSSGNHYVFSLRHSTSLLWRLLVDGAAFFFLPHFRVCSQALAWVLPCCGAEVKTGRWCLSVADLRQGAEGYSRGERRGEGANVD